MIEQLHRLTDPHMTGLLFGIAIVVLSIVAILSMSDSQHIAKHGRKYHVTLHTILFGIVIVFVMNMVIRQWYPMIEEDFYKKCETGEYQGIQCFEDVLTEKAVTPEDRDPLHVRQQ